MRLDVYDFDHTLYNGDTIVDFWLFSVRRHPSILRHVPRQLRALVSLALGRWSTGRVKSEFQCFFGDLPMEEEIEAFWASPRSLRKLYRWHTKQPSDLPRVVASASAKILLLPIAEQLMADAIIATEVDPASGRLLGPNCKGSEKIKALEQHFPGFSVRAMYTDDPKADGPLLQIAEEKVLVKKGKLRRLS